MKIIKRAYKLRLYPNEHQKKLLDIHFGCARFVYNYFLDERNKLYKNEGGYIHYNEQAKELTILKRKKEYSWLNYANAQSLQYALRNLENAYMNFYKGRTKLPVFHSRKRGSKFHVPQDFEIKNGRLYIPKIRDGIKFATSYKDLGNMKGITISITSSGKYYASISSEVEYNPLKKTNSMVGIDLGIKDLLITSDGIKYPSNNYLNKYYNKISKLQKYLSRKKKGSSSWNKNKIKIARLYDKIYHCKMDKLHKISTEIVRNYSVICCEDLDISQMLKKHSYAKSIMKAGWGIFIKLLKYKSEWNNRLFIQVGRYYPSSKVCNKCGYIKKDITIKDRKWICPNCGAEIDRDINAAKNILDEGLRKYRLEQPITQTEKI